MTEDGGIFLRSVFSETTPNEPNAHCAVCKRLNAPNFCNALGIEYSVPDIHMHIECDWFVLMAEEITQ